MRCGRLPFLLQATVDLLLAVGRAKSISISKYPPGRVWLVLRPGRAGECDGAAMCSALATGLTELIKSIRVVALRVPLLLDQKPRGGWVRSIRLVRRKLPGTVGFRHGRGEGAQVRWGAGPAGDVHAIWCWRLREDRLNT